jgi:hypothetical protein
MFGEKDRLCSELSKDLCLLKAVLASFRPTIAQGGRARYWFRIPMLVWDCLKELFEENYIKQGGGKGR